MPQGVRGEQAGSHCQGVPSTPLLRVVCYREPLADDGPDAPPVELARTEVPYTARPSDHGGTQIGGTPSAHILQ